MDKVKIGDMDMELPPLRSLDDFLLESARFQIPNIKDFEKWGNRVVNNLLYYQTNYMFMFVIIFLIVGLIHPVKMIVGVLAILVISCVFIYMSTEGRAIHQFKVRYPYVGILFNIIAGCFVTYTLGSLLVFLLGFLLPFCDMGRRKSQRKAPQRAKAIQPLDTLFTCPFCNHENSCEVQMDKVKKTAKIACRICFEDYQTAVHQLSEPLDVYNDWIDACELIN